LVLCLLGGALGVASALLSEPLMIAVLGTMFPGYAITPQTMAFAMAIAGLIGLLAGIVPAFTARRMGSVEALRSV
jgi:hypothetical protein